MPLLYAESSGEVLKFIFATAHKINVVGKSWVAHGPFTNGDGHVVVMECFLHDLLYEKLNRKGESKHP